MLAFLRGLSIFMFLSTAGAVLFLVMHLVSPPVPDDALYDVSILAISLPWLVISIGIAVFLTVWIPVRYRQIDRMLVEVADSGHLAVATFSHYTPRHGIVGDGFRQVRGYGVTAYYIDEQGKRRQMISRETFQLDEAKKFEEVREFLIKCKGKLVVVLTENTLRGKMPIKEILMENSLNQNKKP